MTSTNLTILLEDGEDTVEVSRCIKFSRDFGSSRKGVGRGVILGGGGVEAEAGRRKGWAVGKPENEGSCDSLVDMLLTRPNLLLLLVGSVIGSGSVSSNMKRKEGFGGNADEAGEEESSIIGYCSITILQVDYHHDHKVGPPLKEGIELWAMG
ncbi:hypothetical protein CDL15_Pgr005463 [Punica granatum]|uniref:Uncharacterized protein n=1 Tax=Punica granatum TaxID=22663 RepID=A0A218WVG6_PUNGR|nr:hypothetical protein CDL15_Pgr005463 [Punica granatum]